MARIIMLDPGHGGVNVDNNGKKEPGIVANGLYECMLTLTTAKKVKEYLEKRYDVQVILTRTDDTYLDLGARGKLALNTAGVELFVSIHYNGFNSLASGYEDYVHTNANAKNIAIQQAIHTEVANYVKSKGIEDRGMKKEDFQVLRDTYSIIPSILLEGLFIDSQDDLKKIVDLTYLDGYCLAVCEGIAKAMGLTKLNAQTSDFGVEVENNLVAQYSTLAEAQTKVTQLYNGGNTSEFKIVAKRKLPLPTVQKTREFNFVGKSLSDGDKTRAIWYTGDFSEDKIPEDILSEVNSGYAGVSKKDGETMSLEVDGVVGKQIQFEFDFDLSELGSREDILRKLKKLDFYVTPGNDLDFDVKIYNPINKSFVKLGTCSSGATYKVVDSDFLNVRQEPSVDGALLGKLYLSNTVTVLAIDEYGWAKIKFNGGLAYCSSAYLKYVSGSMNVADKVFSVSTDLLNYISPNGYARFNIVSTQKSVGQIPLKISVDYAKMVMTYME